MLKSSSTKSQQSKSHRRFKLHPLLGAAILILIVAALTVGFLALRQYEYNRGIEAGKAEQQENTKYHLSELAGAVSEKEFAAQKINQLMTAVPAELTTEGIDQYIKNLESVVSEIKSKKAKTILSQYLAAWQDFKTVYASEDNDQITESFTALNSTATTTAESLQKYYDSKIEAKLKAIKQE